MRYLAVIPARGGSKGVVRKNLRVVGGRPLVAWSVQHALDAATCGRVLVSTDDPEIAECAREAGADVPFLRPAELAADDTPTEPVLIHAVRQLLSKGEEYDALVLLQPTSPVRLPGTLRRAITRFESDEADSLVTVSECVPFLWRYLDRPEPLYDVRSRPRRQDLRPGERVYRENGSIYITRIPLLLKEQNRVAGRVSLLPLEAVESYDIDTEEDLLVVDAILSTLVERAATC